MEACGNCRQREAVTLHQCAKPGLRGVSETQESNLSGECLQVRGGYDSEHKSASVEKSLGTLHFFDPSHPVYFSVIHAFPYCPHSFVQSALHLLPNPEASGLPGAIFQGKQTHRGQLSFAS